MNTNIVEGYSNIDRVHSIEKEREKIMADTQFQKWCRDMKIGSRIEVKDYRADELMQQYPQYPQWVTRMY